METSYHFSKLFELWQIRDQALVTLINSTLSLAVVYVVVGVESAIDVWKALEKRFTSGILLISFSFSLVWEGYIVFSLNRSFFSWWWRKDGISVLRIFEWGKYFKKSVFMGKSAALWLIKNIEHTVIGVNPKQFFKLREGDTAYTLQRGSNSFGQFLLVSKLKVGGLRRSVIIPKGKEKHGWKVFGLELRKMLELNQYAFGH